jgi:hypothetical protein
MSYIIKDDQACATPLNANVEVVDGKIRVTFQDGTVKEALLPTYDYTEELSGKAPTSHQHVLSDITDYDPTAFATAAQGAKADTALQPGLKLSELNNDLTGLATSQEVSQVDTGLTNHKNDSTNPHNVTKAQVGLSEADNTADINKPVSNPTNNAINSAKNAAISHTNSSLTSYVKKVTGSRLMTTAEGDKIANFDDKHYRQPVNDLTSLGSLLEANLYDKERRFVASEGKDYFYDAEAVTGDVAPSDQTNNTGFWSTVNSTSDSYSKWVLKTGGTFRKNMTKDATLDLKGQGLISVAYSADGVVTYSTTATQNSTDSELRDRSTHTGEQPISTVTGLQDELDNKVLKATQNEIDQMNTDVTWIPGTLYVIPC